MKSATRYARVALTLSLYLGGSCAAPDIDEVQKQDAGSNSLPLRRSAVALEERARIKSYVEAKNDPRIVLQTYRLA